MTNYVSSREAGLRLGLSPAKIQRMVRNGEFPGFKICPKTQSFLIPENLLPPPSEKLKTDEENLLNNFLYYDILTDKERKNIASLPYKKSELIEPKLNIKFKNDNHFTETESEVNNLLSSINA